jgi:parallel beta-helix repeat protein
LNIKGVNSLDNGISLTNVSNVQIINNKITNNHSNSIRIESGSAIKILNNTMQNNLINCSLIVCNNSIISNNYCSYATRDAISIANGSHDITVNGNNCTYSEIGIYVTGSLSNVYSNTINGNTCSYNSLYGILLRQTSKNTVSNNAVQQNGRHGIYIDTNCIDNSINGNICDSNSQTTHNTYDNIFVYASDYNNIQGNICRKGSLVNQPRYGIRIDDIGSVGNIVTNNDLYSSGASGSLSDGGTGTVTTSGNRI